MSNAAAQTRNLLSMDSMPWAIDAVIDFLGAAGAPLLKQWQVSQPGSEVGDYVNAPLGGCAGVVGCFKRGTGDFRLVLMEPYSRVKGLLPTYDNSAHLGIAAPYVTLLGGRLDAVGYPDLTDTTVERLEAGNLTTGTGSSPQQPAFIVGSTPAWTSDQFAGMTLVDSAGTQFLIITNTSDHLYVDGIVTPASGGTWQITAGGIVVTSNAVYGGAVSVADFVQATFTVSGSPNWLVNRWTNHVLVDDTGATFVIASNTISVLTLQAVNLGGTPSDGAWIIEQGYVPGGYGNRPTLYGVTGPQITGVANTATSSANTWDPAGGAVTSWVAGIFAGMYLIDTAGVYWLITDNSTTTLTLASNGSQTTPTPGATWSINSVAGGASIEFSTKALSGSGSGLTFTGTPHTLAGTNSTSAVTGTAAAQAFTGTPAGIANNTPVFSGTGYAAVGQVITTTGTFTMTLNQLAGMFFVSASGDVVEIVSNTAVAGAVAVLTVRGKATTDLGAFDILTGPTPAGTNAASASLTATAAAQTFTGESYTPAGTVTGSLTATYTATNPASGERLLLTANLSDSTVQT